MKLQDSGSISSIIEEPYGLFSLWIHDKVLVIRPTKEVYLQDGDDKVIKRAYKEYGWYSGIYTFNIDKKGKVKYHYSSPDGITNIDKMYKKRHNNKIISDIAYNIKDIEDTISKLNFNILEEKERRNIIIPRNTKFIVREMSGLSNKEYKQLFKYYHTNELKKASDPYIKGIVDVLAEDYGIEVDSDFISYAKLHAKPKPDSPFQTIAIIDIINAMIKLKDKIGDKENE